MKGPELLNERGVLFGDVAAELTEHLRGGGAQVRRRAFALEDVKQDAVRGGSTDELEIPDRRSHDLRIRVACGRGQQSLGLTAGQARSDARGRSANVRVR